MTGNARRSRRWLLALPLGLAAILVGSILAVAQKGDAASKVAPSNTAPPVISGTAQVGSTLTTSDGTWNGTTPFTYTYVWRRCDANGASCSTISGATAATYVLTSADLGTTLRSVVTATNSDGNDNSTSVPTAVVTAAAATTTTTTTATPSATGCPSGTGAMQIGDVSSPAHLAIDQQTVSPSPVTPASTSLQVHVRVTACGGRPVQGALVYVTAVPFSQYSVPPEATSGADGTVILTMNQESGFPAARHQELLVMFVRARKPGEDIQAGIAARLLVSFPVKL
jgi:hypothetical protein